MNQFESIQVQKQRRNAFNLSHDHKLTMNMGQLVPIACMETMPGDTFIVSAEHLLRMAPLASPVMHRLDLTVHAFYVPARLCWQGFPNWIAGNDNQLNSTVHPYMNITDQGDGSLQRYLGVPKNQADTPPAQAIQAINPLPFMAYWLIWKDYYRDQNLQPLSETGQLMEQGLPEGLLNTANAAMITELTQLRERAWPHDYFTSALPWPQKGDAVDIPLGNVTLKDDWKTGAMDPLDDQAPVFRGYGQGDDINNGALTQTLYGGSYNQITTFGEESLSTAYDPQGTLEVQPTTINSLREAFAVQRWLERQGRSGSRYIETMWSQFQVKSSDARLQRPEFLGGSKTPIKISEVLQAAPSVNPEADIDGVATMFGHGVTFGSSQPFRYWCEEYGFIMLIASVRPQTAYQQGLPRMFGHRRDRYDYPWPLLAHLGEQEVLNKELYYDVPASPDGWAEETFGFQPRYTEFRYHPSRTSGEFMDTLAFWTLTRIFDDRPALNENFILCQPDTRIFAVQEGYDQYLWCHFFINCKAIRPLPKYGTPI